MRGVFVIIDKFGTTLKQNCTTLHVLACSRLERLGDLRKKSVRQFRSI
jgi:hypothetical protein